MKIRGAESIAEFKKIRDYKIQKWIDSNFVAGSVEWKMHGANAFEITDKFDDKLIIQLDDID